MTQFIASPPQLMFAIGLLVFLSVLASRLSDRFGVPTLLMFLAIGMFAGSDGVGGIYFDDARLANLIGVFALAYILFSGGLDTHWPAVRPVLGRGLALATAGVVITATLTGLFVWALSEYTLKEGLLLGAIVSSTDAAAVFAIMRARGVGLKGRLKPLLELESGSNDPMAVFLTLAMVGLLTSPAAPWSSLLPALALGLSVGLGVGVAVGLGAAFVFNRLRLEYEGLYPVLSMSLVLLAYGLSETLRGNGFLSVYACGIVLGSRDFLFKHYLKKFHDALGWLMQIVLFLVLGLLVFPSRLPGIAVPAILVTVFLMFVARPVAVHFCLLGRRFTWREQTLVAWTGLRGAVPIVLATYPYLAGYVHSDAVFNIVFFIVLASVLLQGRTLMTVARWLRVDAPLASRPRSPLEFEKRAGFKSESREVDIAPESAAVGRRVSELGLPEDALIVLIRRGDSFLVPKGGTTIEAFDTVTFIAGRSDIPAVQASLLAARETAEG